MRACDEGCYIIVSFSLPPRNMQDKGCTACMPTTVSAVTEQSFSPTKSQPVFLDPPRCAVQQCNMQSSAIYMTPVEEVNRCHDSADLVVLTGCETMDQYADRMVPEQQLTAPVNETQKSPVEEVNQCHNSADLVVGRVLFDQRPTTCTEQHRHSELHGYMSQ